MKKVFLTLLSIAFHLITVQAFTYIPVSQEERSQLIDSLEKKYEESKETRTLRNLSLILSVDVALNLENEKILEKTLVYFRKAERLFPEDFELISAYGNTLTLQARNTDSKKKQLFYIRKGTEKMDFAVQKAPDNAGALLYRAYNSLYLPTLLRRTRYAVQDFTRLLEILDDTDSVFFKTLKEKQSQKNMQAQLLFLLGQSYEKIQLFDKAETHWGKARDLDESPWSERAKEAMDL